MASSLHGRKIADQINSPKYVSMDDKAISTPSALLWLSATTIMDFIKEVNFYHLV